MTELKWEKEGEGEKKAEALVREAGLHQYWIIRRHVAVVGSLASSSHRSSISNYFRSPRGFGFAARLAFSPGPLQIYNAIDKNKER